MTDSSWTRSLGEVALYQHCAVPGYARLLGIGPSRDNLDAWIARCARQSTTKASKGEEQDRKLIRRLMFDRHTSPFEMVQFYFELKVPIFVARQLVRHRTHSMNEYSRRYSAGPPEFYFPQHTSETLLNCLIQSSCTACQHYLIALDLGDKPEDARMLLPQNLYTEIVWSQNLHNLLHLLALRLDPHAQREIREMAEAMLSLIAPYLPHTIAVWREWRASLAPQSQQPHALEGKQ